ncbi:MOP flippase family protein [Microcystis aeruginosa]|uniref:MOP flippase family protein n=1 Tax=Microcystis aeruginosa TaxID=1126 RepID=UPI0007765ACE|nr:MOP flippase family protein [Microcystis aeruginosa]KXS89469.1 flippase [Microcystis aeruginosa NIES-88]BCU11903.1 lipopolysaccharide biosynthesis protein [Microcystis aeruginosa]
MSLKQASISGVKWSSISQFSRQIMQLVTTAVLARLLSPSDFGLVGMATITIGFVGIFSDLGTSSAIIQRKNLSDSLLNSLFWINVVFGLLAMVILLIMAPLVASFYQEPRVTLVLRVLSFTFSMSGISILQKAILERNLAFNTSAKIEISAVVAGSLLGISTAIMGWGVWSLVTQSLAVVSLTTILLWTVSKWQPKLAFSWEEVQEVSNYSLNLTAFSIFNYFARNADYILIGRFLGTQDLGYYTLAYRLMLYPLQNVSAVIGRVMFPALSKLQDDNARFSFAYLKVSSTIALISFPLMVSLWALAKPFVLTFFGQQWQPVILLLMILAPVGMSQSIMTTVGIIYQVKGRTDWLFRWGIGAGMLIIIAFVIGLQWGIVGVAAAYAIASFCLTYPCFAIPFRLINLPVRDLGAVLWRPLVASLIMLGLLLVVGFLLPANLASGWVLGISVPIGCITYLLASWWLNRKQIQQLFDMIGVKK